MAKTEKATNPTLSLKCECGIEETTKDYIEVPEKCAKCGTQIQVTLADNPRPWEKKGK